MKIQVLMAAMNLKTGIDLPIGFKELNKNKVKCTVINQCEEIDSDIILNQANIKVFTYVEKGLSKSRNRNLDVLSEKLALITDQDIEFKKGFHKTIITAFEQNPKADIITFQIEETQGKPSKKYRKKAFWMNQRDIMKVSSAEIAFRAASIRKTKLRFDEEFGLGAAFPTGEEAIFLSDALKKGLKIRYFPFPIVIHPKASSGYQFLNNKDLIRAKGAMFYRMFGQMAYVISILFAIKKFKMSSENLIDFVKQKFMGISSYKKLHYE